MMLERLIAVFLAGLAVTIIGAGIGALLYGLLAWEGNGITALYYGRWLGFVAGPLATAVAWREYFR